MLLVYPIDYHKFYDYAVSAVQSPYSIWLDSGDTEHKNGNFSFVLTEPLVKISSNIQKCLFDFLKNYPLFNSEVSKNLTKERKKYKNLPPFIGGFAGFMSYDYCVQHRFNLFAIPTAINKLPQFYGGIYDIVLYADHITHQAGIIGLNIQKNQNLDKRIDRLLNQEKSKKAISSKEFSVKIPVMDSKAYKNAVDKTIDYIKKGDIFQANIAHFIHLKRAENFDSLEFYKKLREINPAPFGCYIHDSEFQIMSSSPERFLKIDNQIIIAEPIKGTIKSNPDAFLDDAQKNILLNCPKNRAENIMIVDLLRNDITPYAKTGTIKADILCEVQTFKGLHHLVSRIRAEIKDNEKIIDILKMALPGGSITGAPKKRVCEIIYELEQTQRGAYCGNAGYIGFDNTSDMNILIRTVQADTQSIIIHSGCGITAQSDAESEWLETQTKINKILDVF